MYELSPGKTKWVPGRVREILGPRNVLVDTSIGILKRHYEQLKLRLTTPENPFEFLDPFSNLKGEEEQQKLQNSPIKEIPAPSSTPKIEIQPPIAPEINLPNAEPEIIVKSAQKKLEYGGKEKSTPILTDQASPVPLRRSNRNRIPTKKFDL